MWLDATMIDDFERRFPTIWAACSSAGLDPTVDWLPVAPAAHYLSGGVVTDLDGASTLPHLWACGETACSGVHGANRLASNSLLDGLVFGRRVVAGIVAGKHGPEPTGAMAGVLSLPLAVGAPATDPVVLRKEQVSAPEAFRGAVQRTMSHDCGVVRDAAGLRMAADTLADLATLADDLPAREIATYEVDQSRPRVPGDRGRRARPRGVPRRAHARRRSLYERRLAGPPRDRRSRAAALRRSPRPRTGESVTTFDAPASVVGEVVAAALAEDLGLLGDITSIACIRDDQTATAVFVAREEGVLAGTALVDEVYRQVDPEVDVTWKLADGDAVEAGTELGEVSGSLRSILAGERVALNFLCHCSGVASLTRRYVRAARRRPASSTRARRCPACAASSAPRCGPAAGSTTATRCRPRC